MSEADVAPRDRWYVLSALTIAYALNIADRFSISTLTEPIRLEFGLSDGGVAFPTAFRSRRCAALAGTMNDRERLPRSHSHLASIC